MDNKKQKNRGAAILIAVLFFVIISLLMVIGISSSTTRDYITTREFQTSKRAFYLAEAGVENAMYLIRKGVTPPALSVISLNGVSATTVITDVNAGEKTIVATASIDGLVRRVSGTLTKLTPVSFSFGAQIGDGGVDMQNSSRINGDVYSTGPIEGIEGSSIITGGVFSVSTSTTPGSIDGITNEGTNRMYAGNTINGSGLGSISNSTAGGKIYCTSSSDTSPATCTPFYRIDSNQKAKTFPLKDTQISTWEAAAASGGTQTGCSGGGSSKYVISSDRTIGPKKIPCNLEVSGAGTVVTLTGAVWVEGDISLKNGAEINIDAALGSSTVPLIADPGTSLLRKTKGKIEIENGATFNIGGNADAHVLLFSWNTGALEGSGAQAVEVKNTVDGNVLIYAQYGAVALSQSAEVSNVVAHKITMKNSSKINYTTNLQDILVYDGATSLAPWSIYNLREVP